MVKHYAGDWRMGSFDYDDELWEIIENPASEEMQSTNYLH